MQNHSCLHEDTIRYLERFYDILDTMIYGMTHAERTQSISHNFIVQMIPHHRAAIEMSQNVLLYTKNAPLRRIASNIITEQTQSIANMEKALAACSRLTNSPAETALYQRRMDQIMRTMFAAMDNAPETNRIDVDFMLEMIPHHQGAIRMSETTLQYRICPELTPILRAILVSQRRGVREMQALLRQAGVRSRS